VLDIDRIGFNDSGQKLLRGGYDEGGFVPLHYSGTANAPNHHAPSMPLDSLLIAITPVGLPEDQLVARCRAVEAGGATSVQVRLKDRPSGDVYKVAQTLVNVLNIPVYVNDRTDIALAAHADGVHVGATDLPAHRLRSVAPRPLRLGVSVGSPEEAQRAVAADADYWSIGPFAATTTKADAGAALGQRGFAALAQLAPAGTAIVAIGGIDLRTAPLAIGAGATGIAAVTALFASSDVVAATRALRHAVDTALAQRAASDPR
jgi:thiamine-phosphate pyrophosphorylase